MRPDNVEASTAIERVIQRHMNNIGVLEFVMCIGDDRSDVPLFDFLHGLTDTVPSVYTATVNQQATRAQHAMLDPENVVDFLQRLDTAVRNSESMSSLNFERLRTFEDNQAGGNECSQERVKRWLQ